MPLSATDRFITKCQGKGDELYESRGEYLFGPHSLFHQAVAELQQYPSRTKDFWDALVHVREVSEKIAQRELSPALIQRWDIIEAAAKARLANIGADKLSAAARLVEYSEKLFTDHGASWGISPQDKYPAPNHPSPLLDSYGTIFTHGNQNSWSAGRYLAFDILRFLENDPPAREIMESVPILVAFSAGGAMILKLCVARQEGAGGLVLPDFWRLGLLPLVGVPQGKTMVDDFTAVTQTAMRAALPAHPTCRLTWWLERHHSTSCLPEHVRGRSAQAAAVCAALAVQERATDSVKPLLNPLSAISATLNTKSSNPVDDVRKMNLGVVNERSLGDKIAAAQRGGLTLVLFADNQKPTELVTQNSSSTTNLHQVSTIARAYNALLQISTYIASYRAQERASWRQQWDWEE